LFSGAKRVFVHADFVKEIQDIIEFKKKYEIENLVIVGGYDSHLVAENLKNNNIPIVLRRLHSLPMYAEDDVDLPYKLPKMLQDAGVKFCLNNAGGMEQMGTRNLPFYAGTAAAYGLSYEEAVASITLSTAEILGMEETIGSLEVGKDATLVVSKGDALDMRTNKITTAMVQGRFVSTTNHQDVLYNKYKTKYGLND
jgi:imidazolonepropionase-like amidohydrolase